MPWARPGPGRPPRLPDAAIAELRRRHILQNVPLETLIRETGMGKSMLTKIMTGKRRKGAGGPLRDAKAATPVTTKTITGIRQDLAAGRKQAWIARKYGVSPQYVSNIKNGRRGT